MALNCVLLHGRATQARRGYAVFHIEDAQTQLFLVTGRQALPVGALLSLAGHIDRRLIDNHMRLCVVVDHWQRLD